MSGDRLDQVMRALVSWRESASPPIDRRGLGSTELITGARRHRLVGVLAAALAAGDIDVDDPDAVAGELGRVMGEALLLEDVMLDAIDVLVERGIDYRVLKGSALAHTVHRDPSHRSFGDTDLLVRSSQIDEAVAALTDAGGDRPVPPLSSDFDRRFAKSVTLGWLRGTELDLHRTLAPGPFGLRIHLDDLWGDAFVYGLAGEFVRTLSPELHLLNGAYHVVLGDTEPRYGNVRDIALLLESDIDVDLVASTAARWRGDVVVAEAIDLVRSMGGSVGALGDWADDVDGTGSDRRSLATYRRRHGRFRRQALAVLAELGWSDRLAYAMAVGLPSRAHREARRRGRG